MSPPAHPVATHFKIGAKTIIDRAVAMAAAMAASTAARRLEMEVVLMRPFVVVETLKALQAPTRVRGVLRNPRQRALGAQ